MAEHRSVEDPDVAGPGPPNLQVFVTSMSTMVQVTTWLALIGAVLAVWLRSGPVKVDAGAPPRAALD